MVATAAARFGSHQDQEDLDFLAGPFSLDATVMEVRERNSPTDCYGKESQKVEKGKIRFGRENVVDTSGGG